MRHSTLRSMLNSHLTDWHWYWLPACLHGNPDREPSAGCWSRQNAGQVWNYLSARCHMEREESLVKATQLKERHPNLQQTPPPTNTHAHTVLDVILMQLTAGDLTFHCKHSKDSGAEQRCRNANVAMSLIPHDGFITLFCGAESVCHFLLTCSRVAPVLRIRWHFSMM